MSLGYGWTDVASTGQSASLDHKKEADVQILYDYYICVSSSVH